MYKGALAMLACQGLHLWMNLSPCPFSCLTDSVHGLTTTERREKWTERKLNQNLKCYENGK